MTSSILHTFPIERYRLKGLGFLGQGAHGTVSHYERLPWYFWSYDKPKEVAVKIFQQNESDKLAAELEHIVKVRVEKSDSWL